MIHMMKVTAVAVKPFHSMRIHRNVALGSRHADVLLMRWHVQPTAFTISIPRPPGSQTSLLGWVRFMTRPT